MPAVRTSLVIATRRRAELLRETLESLSGCAPAPDELIVVDGDAERSAEPVVEQYRARGGVATRYVPSPPGLPLQRNRGIEAASGEVLVFADDDVEFDPRLFEAIERAYLDPSVVGATARVIEPDERRVGGAQSRLRDLLPGGGREGTMTRFGYPRRLVRLDEERDVEFLHGCLMSARREQAALLRFDERLAGYALAEDEDFGYRLSRLGRVRYLPDAVVVHKNLGFRSTGSREFNRMLVVNRAYLFRKNFSPTALARLQFALMVALLVAHRALNGEWAGARGLADGAAQAWRDGTG